MQKLPLRLTADEKTHIFDKLPEPLRKKWESRLEIETLESFESVEELKSRLEKLSFDEYPDAVKVGEKALKAAMKGKALKAMDAKKFPQEAMPRFFHAIGACGISAMMQAAMQGEDVDNTTLESVAGLSLIRHVILQDNSAKVA